MKKNIITLIASVLILALLGGGYYFAVKWQPEKEEEPESQSTIPDYEELIDFEIENVLSVTVNTGESEYTLVNGEPAEIKGYSSLLISSDSVLSALRGALYLSGTHKIENAGEKLSDYGLSEKKRFFTVNLKDGTQKTVIEGNKTNYDDSCYAMLEGTDTVFVVASYKLDSIFKEPSSLRSTDICTFDIEKLTALSVSKGNSTVLSIEKAEKEVKEEEALYDMLAFNITYPYSNLPASADRLDELFKKFTFLAAYEITEENPSDLSKYGLMQPTVVTVTEGDTKHIIKLGKKLEGSKVYLMYNDVNVVYTVQCDFYDAVVNLDAAEYLEKFIHLFNIASVESISLKIDNKESLLELKGYDGEKGTGTFLVNGKKTDEKTFKNLYQAVIGIKLSSVAESEPSGEEKASITFKFTDKTSKTFTYYKNGERHLSVKADSGINCLVLEKDVDAIKELLK